LSFTTGSCAQWPPSWTGHPTDLLKLRATYARKGG